MSWLRDFKGLRIRAYAGDGQECRDALAAAEQRAANLDCALTEMCARVEIAEQQAADAEAAYQALVERANILLHDARRWALRWKEAAKGHRAAASWQLAMYKKIYARAETAEAALRTCQVQLEFAADWRERACIAETALAKAWDVLRLVEWSCDGHCPCCGAYMGSNPHAQTCELDNIVTKGSRAAAQELSALQDVAEAASIVSDSFAEWGEHWDDDLFLCFVLEAGRNTFPSGKTRLFRVRRLQAALDAARGQEKGE